MVSFLEHQISSFPPNFFVVLFQFCIVFCPIDIPSTVMLSSFHVMGTGPCVFPVCCPINVPSVLVLLNLLPDPDPNLSTMSKHGSTDW